MSKIKLYTVDYCPYCKKAKRFFDEKGIDYENVDLTNDPNMRNVVKEITGGASSTVPQIFIDEKLIGGWSDLEKLVKSGELNI